jgi:hypothetical protein
MSLTLRRVVATAGATALIAGAAIVAAPPAQADGGYYGSWTLAAVKIAGDRVDCPGTLPFPPPTPPISCTAGATLQLRSDYTYKSTLPTVFRGARGKGSFDVVKLVKGSSKTIVFESNVDTQNPRAYRMKLQGTRDGTPKKMVIFLTYNTPSGEDLKISMILHRDGK